VKLTVVASEHREVVPPAEPEDLHLAPVSQPRSQVGDLQGLGQLGVEIGGGWWLARQRRVECRREDGRPRIRQTRDDQPLEIDRPRGPDPPLTHRVHRDHDRDEHEHDQDDRRHRFPLLFPLAAAGPAAS
jgi:hypothetical protein